MHRSDSTLSIENTAEKTETPTNQSEPRSGEPTENQNGPKTGRRGEILSNQPSERSPTPDIERSAG